MPKSTNPRFAIADCITLDLIPDLCCWAATCLHEQRIKFSDILYFEVCDTPRAPGEKVAPSDAPERLICITRGVPAREFISLAILEVKKSRPPGRDPQVEFRPSLSLRDVFQKMKAADNTAMSFVQEGEDPLSLFFIDGAFTVSEVGKALTKPRF